MRTRRDPEPRFDPATADAVQWGVRFHRLSPVTIIPGSLLLSVGAVLLLTLTAPVPLLGGQASGTSAPAAVDAAALYKAKCAMCHGAAGNSPVANMSFTDGKWLHGSSPKDVAKVIRDGVPRTAMLGFKKQFSEDEIEALAAHVRSFDKALEPAK
jgi:mono/diheme cytochrome c family protein